MTNTEKITALQRARDALRQREWCQLNFHDQSGAICATTALALGQGFDVTWYLYTEGWHGMINSDLLEDVVADLPRATHPFMDASARLCAWNNEPNQTKENIIAQFQVTIDRLTANDRELVDA
jgi:hypothetical protein